MDKDLESVKFNLTDEQKYYFDDKQIEYVVINEYDDLHALMDNKALKPNVIGIQYTNKSITSKNDGKQIGIYSSILVYIFLLSLYLFLYFFLNHCYY